MEKLYLDKERVLADDAYFAEKLLSFKAFPYQEKIDFSKNKIFIRGGRRTGKDTLIINRRIIPFMWKNKRVKVGVYAPGWEEADTFMDIFRESIEGTPLEKSIVVNNKFEIELSNHSRLLCRIASKVSTGKRGRGFDLLYFTEAEYIADEEYAAIRPSRLVGSAPEILASSPNGDDNFCSRAEYSGLYDVHVWTTGMNPLIDPSELENEKKLCTEIEFRQEYMAERISGAGQAIPDKLIQKMYENKNLEFKEKAEAGKVYVAGVDLGRRRDKSTLYVLQVDWPHLTIVYYKEFEIQKEDPRFWVKVLEHLAWAMVNFNLSKIRMDQTGLGDMPTMELKRTAAEKSIPCVVEGVDFSYALKHKWEGIINQGILKFERFEIHSPFIKKLVVQLRSIRFDPKTKMYEARGPSPDHVMALFLGISAVGQQRYYFGSAANRSQDDIERRVESEKEEIKAKVKTGYALKASELGPEHGLI